MDTALINKKRCFGHTKHRFFIEKSIHSCYTDFNMSGGDFMLSFESDYTEGAHGKILERLLETNMEQLSGYGKDKYSDSAKEKIK